MRGYMSPVCRPTFFFASVSIHLRYTFGTPQRRYVSLKVMEAGLPWAQRETESSKAYALFRLFLEGGATRSYAQVVADAGAYGIPTTLAAVKKLAQRHQWSARARAYDHYLMQQQAQQQVEREGEWRARRLHISTILIEKALSAIQQFSPADLKPREAALLLKLGIDLRNATPDAPAGDAEFDYWENPVVWRLVDAYEDALFRGDDTKTITDALRLVLNRNLPPTLKAGDGSEG